MKCIYCKGKVCDGKRKTIYEWNKCPYQKAIWETDTSILIYLMNLFTFGIVGYFILKSKLGKVEKK